MARPKVYLTRRLPDQARAIVAAECDMTEWGDEHQPVPRDELLRSVADVDGVLALLTEQNDQQFLESVRAAGWWPIWPSATTMPTYPRLPVAACC